MTELNTGPGTPTNAGVLVETDENGLMQLPAGFEDAMFLARDNGDGSILLQPAIRNEAGVVVTMAQHAYDTDPELRRILDEASTGPYFTRTDGGWTPAAEQTS